MTLERTIKSQLRQDDKDAFIQNLMKKSDDDQDDINAIRQSLHDYANSTYEEFSEGYLTERHWQGHFINARTRNRS